jgi:hypothetical protein
VPAITSVLEALSLDITSHLVAVGIQPSNGWPLTIVGATNASPVVLTTAAPHDLVLPIHGVVSGVLGNAGANSVGAPFGAWICTPVPGSVDELTLTTINDDGTYSNSVGTGTYAGGGTIATALTDGRIELGEEHRSENSSPPRIIFVPVISKFTASTQAMRGPRPITGLKGHPGQTQEMLRQRWEKMIAREDVHFAVTVWGAGNPPDPYKDFDVTQVLYQQLIRTCEHQIQGAYTLPSQGDWVDQHKSATQFDKLGHKIMFPLTVYTPVTDYPYGITTVQQVTGIVSIKNPASDTIEEGWTGTVPQS